MTNHFSDLNNLPHFSTIALLVSNKYWSKGGSAMKNPTASVSPSFKTAVLKSRLSKWYRILALSVFIFFKFWLAYWSSPLILADLNSYSLFSLIIGLCVAIKSSSLWGMTKYVSSFLYLESRINSLNFFICSSSFSCFSNFNFLALSFSLFWLRATSCFSSLIFLLYPSYLSFALITACKFKAWFAPKGVCSLYPRVLR